MSGEGISAIILAALAVGGVIYNMGAISQRFSESRESADAEHKKIREEMQAIATTLRNDLNGIGAAQRRHVIDTARQFNNINNIVISAAKQEDRRFVAEYLREEKT